MRIRLFLIIFLVFTLARTMAADDALSILDSLPAPEVKYEKAPKNSYPEVRENQPADAPMKPVEPEPDPGMDFPKEKLVEEISSPALKSFSKLIKNLSRPPELISTESNNLSAAIEKGASATPVASSGSRIRVIQKKSNLLKNLETLKVDQILPTIENSFAENYSLLVDAIEQSQKFAQAQKQGDTPEDEGEGAEGGKTYDSIFAKAVGLQKKEKWKDIQKLFKDNPEAGETPTGLEYLIEAELNSDKINYASVKRYSENLLKSDKKHPMANFGLAMYWYNAKKPNTAKGSSHLAIAMSAKKPPAGASKLYWMVLLKKIWIIILIVLGGIIGGISQVLKKKKAAALLAAGIQPGDGTEASASPAAPPSGKVEEFKAKILDKLKPVLDKLEPILSKIRKKKPEESSTPSNQPGQPDIPAEAPAAPHQAVEAPAPLPDSGEIPAEQVEIPVQNSEEAAPAVSEPGEEN